MNTLAIEPRTKLGKASRKLASGLMPAVYYGRKEASTPVAVSLAAFKKVLEKAGESSVVVLKGAGKELEVLIHAIDFDPIKGEPRHADFYVLEKGKKVRVSVPIHFEGVAPAVKNLGGILIKVLHEIEVEAEPHSLPHAIVANIDGLEALDSKMLIKDITFPAGVVPTDDLEEVIAAIAEPKEEKEEEAPVDLASAVEVEKKGKKEEEGGAESEAATEEK